MDETQITNRINPANAALIPTGNGGALSFKDASQFMEFAKMMAVASVAVPKHLRGNPGACLAVALQASEWQMSPFAVANKSYSVNDRLAYEAQLINAVILQRAPIVGRFEITYTGEGTRRKCTVAVNLKAGGSVSYESPAIGDIKTQNSPLWKSDPDQQLFYFASRSMCRRHFPDVLLGVYTPDEMEGERDVTNSVVARSEPLNPFAALPPIVDPPARPAEPEREEIKFELEPTTGEETPRDEPLIDLLSQVANADPDTLSACVKEVEYLCAEASKLIAKKAITERAAVLGVKWSKAKGGFAS